MGTLLHRLPLWFKSILVYVAIWISFGTMLHFLAKKTLVYIGKEYGTVLTMQDLIYHLDFPIIAVGVLVITALFVVFAYDHHLLMVRVKATIKASLEERKFESQLDDLYMADTDDQVVTDLDKVFKLYKSFDALKTSRLSLEIASIKTLCSQVEEGVVFVNQEKVVTYINHIAESQLGLIPNEILGEAISRKISLKDILEGLDSAIQFDQKIVDEEIQLKDQHPHLLSIFPIKDKFGEIVRAIILLTKASTEDDSDTETIEL